MQWLVVNIFILAIVLIGAGSVWLVAIIMWSLQMPPDDYPGITVIGCVLAVLATYYIGKQLHTLAKRHV